MIRIYRDDTLLWDKVEVANNTYKRFMGLMGRPALPDGGGMLITPCNQVHTFHMRFSLDILYITKDMQVAAIETLPPGKIGSKIKDAHMVLELPADSAKRLNVQMGDYLTIQTETGGFIK